MRFSASEMITTAIVLGRFSTLDTVTILLYNAFTKTLIPVDSDVCEEIGTTGVFIFKLSNITTPLAAFTQIYWEMSNGSGIQAETFEALGWVDSINPLGAEDTCKVTFNLSRQDDEAGVSPNRIQSDLEKAYAEIQGTFFGNTSYFDANRVKPSYDQLTRQGFWVLPQGSTVKFFVKQLNINTTAVIPAQSTIDLNALLTA